MVLYCSTRKAVQSVLPKYMTSMCKKDSKTFQHDVMQRISDNEDVKFHWCLISQLIESYEDQQILLKDIVTLYNTVRGFSIAASWLEDCKKSTYTSMGLRKSLSGSN